VSTEQRENLDAILRQSAFPFDSDVSEQRRLLAEFASAQPLPAGVTVTAAELGGVPTAEITVDGVEPRHVVLYFHGGVYVIGDAFQAAGLASQVGRRTRAKVISVDYRLAPTSPGQCYTPPSRVSWAAHSCWRSTNFWVLPVDVFGSGPNSIESGHL
jgi:monoterpene epsilon-lactone hydrolase